MSSAVNLIGKKPYLFNTFKTSHFYIPNTFVRNFAEKGEEKGGGFWEKLAGVSDAEKLTGKYEKTSAKVAGGGGSDSTSKVAGVSEKTAGEKGAVDNLPTSAYPATLYYNDDSVIKQCGSDVYQWKNYNSFLPPPNIPGIRRAPRMEKEPPLPSTLNRMKIPLPPPGSRMRKYIDPRFDLAAPFVTTALFIWPVMFFEYF